MKLYRLSMLVFAVLILPISCAFAQTALTSLSGTVTDSQGALVTNARLPCQINPSTTLRPSRWGLAVNMYSPRFLLATTRLQ